MMHLAEGELAVGWDLFQEGLSRSLEGFSLRSSRAVILRKQEQKLQGFLGP